MAPFVCLKLRFIRECCLNAGCGVDNDYVEYLLYNLARALFQAPGEEHEASDQEGEEARTNEAL
jgi:hypothetical protein